MLINVHVLSFLMSYGSVYTSCGNSVAMVSYNHIKQSFQRDVIWLLWVNLIFNCIILLMVHIFSSILKLKDALTMEYFIKFHLNLKVTCMFLGLSGKYIFKSAQHIC